MRILLKSGFVARFASFDALFEPLGSPFKFFQINVGYGLKHISEWILGVRKKTPLPWINYLSNGKYCAMISNTGGGYSFYIDPKDLRILRYRYNNLPVDRPGRYIYIKDNNVPEYWSPTWQPVIKKLDHYECRHGLGYTKFSSSFKEIQAKILYFVPIEENIEIWFLKVQNQSSERKELKIFSYAEFCLWNAVSDQRDLQPFTLSI